MSSKASGSVRVLVVVLSSLLCAVAAAQAFASPPTPLLAERAVKTYFDALHRQDLGTLGAVTDGEAARTTLAMIDHIHDEARRKHVGVELKVKSLQITSPGPAAATSKPSYASNGKSAGAASGDEQTQVAVTFDMAVIAKQWIFTKVARELHGHATFSVGKNLAKGDVSEVKIVGIQWAFD